MLACGAKVSYGAQSARCVCVCVSVCVCVCVCVCSAYSKQLTGAELNHTCQLNQLCKVNMELGKSPKVKSEKFPSWNFAVCSGDKLNVV